jgi:hypothetical protein
MRIGEVISEGWAVYRRFLPQFFLTALAVFVVLDLLSALAQEAAGDSTGSAVLWGLVAFAVGIVGYFWVQAALVELVHDVRDGRADRGVADTYRAVAPILPAVIVAGLVAAIAIGIGLILIIIPGLILLTIWSMIVPAIVIERRSASEAFGRSLEIVRGHGFTVFGLILVTFLLIAIAEAVIGAIFSPLPDFLDAWLGSLVAHCLTVPFGAAVLTTAYFRLTGGEPAAAEPAVVP